MTDEQLAADDATRFHAGIEQMLAASKSMSRVNKLDGLTLQQAVDANPSLRGPFYSLTIAGTRLAQDFFYTRKEKTT